jgi:hypothetical protein
MREQEYVTHVNCLTCRTSSTEMGWGDTQTGYLLVTLPGLRYGQAPCIMPGKSCAVGDGFLQASPPDNRSRLCSPLPGVLPRVTLSCDSL